MNKSDPVISQGAGPVAPPPADSGRAARIGLWTLLIGFGGFLLWAGFAPLDEGVPSHGIVTIDTKSKPVQHLTGGIVKQVLVREGDVVKEGQVLLMLDEAVSRANHEAVRQRYLGYRAMQGRLLAEQSGAVSIKFHPDLVEAASDPLIRAQMLTQEQLFVSRKSALRSELQGLEESVAGQQAVFQSYESMLTSRRSQLSLLQEELQHTRGLVKEGYAPRNRQLELERAQAEMQSSLTDLQGNLVRTRHAISEMRQRAITRQQEYRKEVETQLADVTREVQTDAEKIVATKAELERMDVRSPSAGQVVGLVVQAEGAVVQAGQKLMEVVPEGEPLVLEARIEPHLIDKVSEGLLTDIRFSSFAHAPQLVVEGKVTSISRDLLQDQHSGVSYYLARVVVTPDGMKVLGHRRMQPGMPAEVVVKTGERTLLTYLLSPLSKRVAASMKEE